MNGTDAEHVVLELPAQRISQDENVCSHQHKLELEFCGPDGEPGERSPEDRNSHVRFECPCGINGTPYRLGSDAALGAGGVLGAVKREFRNHVIACISRA